MAKEFSDIGNGNGFIYVTGPDGLATSMHSNITNDGDGLRQAKLLAVEGAATSANLISTGSLTFTAISGVLNVTGLLIAGIQQMANSVNVTGLSIAQTAAAVAQEINSTTPASGINFTAASVDDKVSLFASSADGSTPNGNTVAFTTDDPGNITADTVDFAGGADANEIFDEAHGFRLFLDADYLASASSCTGEGTAVEGDLSNAIEITNEIITTITSLKTDVVEIANDSISPTRKGKVYAVEVNTQASAATDDLATIDPAGHSEGDIIILRGQDTGRVVTLNENGNIDLGGGTTFATGSYEKAISLQLWAKGGAGTDELFWFEVSRSTESVASVADFRTNLFPFIGSEGVTTIPASSGGTTTLVSNVDDRVQEINGSDTLTSDFNVFIDTTGAVAGDTFTIGYGASIITGGFEVSIGDASDPVVLTTSQALRGGWIISAYYDGAFWNTIAFPSFRKTALTNHFQLETLFILDDNITPAKLTPEGRTEVITFPVSVDDSDELGDHKVVMPYSGTVVGIDYAVSKDIQGANDASVVAKDNAAGVMATTTITGGSAIGTIFSESPSANNTFVAGDILTFTTSKATVGGKVLVSLKITRT